MDAFLSLSAINLTLFFFHLHFLFWQHKIVFSRNLVLQYQGLLGNDGELKIIMI